MNVVPPDKHAKPPSEPRERGKRLMATKAGISTKRAGKRGQKSKDNRVVSKRSLAQRQKQRELRQDNMAAVIQEANELGIELGPSPGTIYDVMERIFRRTHALWTLAASEVDKLDPKAKATQNVDGKSIWWQSYDRNGNLVITLSKWPAWEQTLREELFDQAIRMGALDVDTKKLHIQTQILDILGRALSNAAAKAGLPEAERRKLGAALREELQPYSPSAPDQVDIDGTAKEAAA